MPSPRLMCLPVPSGKGESIGGERRFGPFRTGRPKEAVPLKAVWKIRRPETTIRRLAVLTICGDCKNKLMGDAAFEQHAAI
jgi:hypothetical protein